LYNIYTKVIFFLIWRGTKLPNFYKNLD